VRLALAVGVVVVAEPHVTRPLRRLMLLVIWVASVGALAAGDAQVVDVLGGIALAGALAALVNLVLGSPAGTPSPSQVQAALESRGVPVHDLAPAGRQIWGEARFTAVAGDGTPLSVAVIGRDTTDARLFSKLWRTVWYRDAGARVALTRAGQVEHQAFVLLLAGDRGVPVPRVVTAGTGGARDDALLVITRPTGSTLAELAAEEGDPGLDDAVLDRMWEALTALHQAGMAHGGLDATTVVVDDGSVTLTGVDRASADAPLGRQDLDVVGLLVATAQVVGEVRALAAARRALGDDRLATVLPMITPAALAGPERTHRAETKVSCTTLRQDGAALLGIDVPEPEELRRVSPTDIVLAVGTVLGAYLLIGQLADLTDVWSTFTSASIGWVVATALIAQLPAGGTGLALVGSVSQQELPLRQTTLLQLANKFTGLVGGTMANLALFTRYLQKRGMGVAVAMSSAALTSVAQFLTQTTLFLVAVIFSAQAFDAADVGGEDGGGGGFDLGLVLYAIMGIGVLLGVVVFVPRLRTYIVAKLAPQWHAAKENIRGVVAEPRRAALLFGGNLAAQLLFALALWAALGAYGYHLPLLQLVVINTIASLLGGIAPVPGGMGVIEAGLIAGLTAAGIPDDAAVAATFTYRAFTAYLPPIWGWASLAWLRKRDLV
jgi:glycosyltransferase 2 family protein